MFVYVQATYRLRCVHLTFLFAAAALVIVVVVVVVVAVIIFYNINAAVVPVTVS